jgi:hypothetical protein
MTTTTRWCGAIFGLMHGGPASSSYEAHDSVRRHEIGSAVSLKPARGSAGEAHSTLMAHAVHWEVWSKIRAFQARSRHDAHMKLATPSTSSRRVGWPVRPTVPWWPAWPDGRLGPRSGPSKPRSRRAAWTWRWWWCRHRWGCRRHDYGAACTQWHSRRRQHTSKQKPTAWGDRGHWPLDKLRRMADSNGDGRIEVWEGWIKSSGTD